MSPELHSLAGAFALDALPGEEGAAFEAHLDTCDTCPQEVREFRDTAAILAAATAVAPPPRMRARVLEQVAVTRQLPAPATPLHRRPAQRFPVRLLVAAAAALLVLAGGLGVGAYQANQRADDLATSQQRLLTTNQQIARLLTAPDRTVSRPPITKASGRATVIASQQVGALAVVADGIADLPAGRTYQLWFIDPQNRATSVGLAQARDGRLVQVIDRTYPPGSTFGMTVEPAGGSAQPTLANIRVLQKIPSPA